MALVFVAGNAADVFAPDLAAAIDAELRTRFPSLRRVDGDAYRSDPVDAVGMDATAGPRDAFDLRAAPRRVGCVSDRFTFRCGSNASSTSPSPTVADPLEVGSLDMLLDELRLFASHASLPTDDVELMQLAAKYLEDDDLFSSDLDIQTYVQLLLTAKQASAHGFLFVAQSCGVAQRRAQDLR